MSANTQSVDECEIKIGGRWTVVDIDDALRSYRDEIKRCPECHGRVRAHKAAFGEFIADGAAPSEQIEFIGLVVDHLTERGAMEPGLLYESPFTDVAPQGPDQVFDGPRIDRLFRVIEDLNQSAVA